MIDNFESTTPIQINSLGFAIMPSMKVQHFQRDFEVYNGKRLNNKTIDQINGVIERFERLTGRSTRSGEVNPIHIISIPNSGRDIVEPKHNLIFLR